MGADYGSPRPNKQAARGWTIPELALYVRMGEDALRNLIRSGKLKAINTASTSCGKPRFVVLPEHLEEFLQSRAAGPKPEACPRRKQKPRNFTDYYPD